jgi:Plasmid pRiA4b ORF-3-like protein
MPTRKRSEIQYLFKVSLKRRRSVWRSVVLHGDQTLDDLHEAIFAAFERYEDHLYSIYFQMHQRVVHSWESGQKNIRLRKDSNLPCRLESITDITPPARNSTNSSSRLVKPLSTFSTSVTSGGTK